MKFKKSWITSRRFIEAGSKNTSLIFFAFLIGLITGLVSSLFRFILIFIYNFRINLYAHESILNWVLSILFGVIGICIAIFLVKKFSPETSGSGVQEIEGALDGFRPLNWKRVLPIKFIASLFSLGSGFLLGREGPTIQLGANIGKMIKDIFKHGDEKLNPLVSAGSSAGLASAFNAPLAGIIFVAEEMHDHFKYSFFSLAAIMVASVTADFVVRVLIGPDPVIKMIIYPNPPLKSIWLFIILGLLFSIIGYLFNTLLIFSLNFVDNLSKTTKIASIIIFALIIVIVGKLFPKMIGGGYSTIRVVLDQSLTLQFLLILFIGRLFLTVFSYGTGAPGGIFAPLLALGIIFGMLFGIIMQHFFPDLISNPGVFAIAGMAGIFASTVRAPLTGLVLAVEMTSNFELILPLMITSVTAAVITAQIGNEPIYTTLLKRTMSIKKSS